MSRAPTTAEVLGQMSTDLPEAVCALRLAGDESLEVFVQWMHDLAAERDSLSERLRSACEERASLEVEGEKDATIADLARAHTASIMEWNRAHATTEPSHEDAMAIFERRDRTLFALLDVLHPGWRDVYDAAWGEEGRARRAAARDGVEGQVSP